MVGLNTALLCQDGYDQGNIALGSKQYQQLPTKSAAKVVLALGHHPPSWLRDGSDVTAWLRRRVDVYLHGHVHEPEFRGISTAAGDQFASFRAGAVHRSSEEDQMHGYSWILVELAQNGDRHLTVWPRIWSPRTKRFVVDSEHTLLNETHGEVVLASPEHA